MSQMKLIDDVYIYDVTLSLSLCDLISGQGLFDFKQMTREVCLCNLPSTNSEGMGQEAEGEIEEVK